MASSDVTVDPVVLREQVKEKYREVADKPDAEFGNAAFESRAQQSCELLLLTIAPHSRGEGWRGARCGVKIDFTDPGGQEWKEAHQPLLNHAPAPGETKDIVVGDKPHAAQPAP